MVLEHNTINWYILELAPTFTTRDLIINRSSSKNSYNYFGSLLLLSFYVHGKHLRSCRDGQVT